MKSDVSERTKWKEERTQQGSPVIFSMQKRAKSFQALIMEEGKSAAASLAFEWDKVNKSRAPRPPCFNVRRKRHDIRLRSVISPGTGERLKR